MIHSNIETALDFKLEPLPLSPREKQWIDTLEFIRDQLLISSSIKLQEPPRRQVEICELDGEIRLYGPSPLQEAFPIIMELQKMIKRLKQALAEQGLNERPAS